MDDISFMNMDEAIFYLEGRASYMLDSLRI